jgi:threonine aldolase
MSDSNPLRRQFASDNCAGICPEAWDAMREANQGYEASYGDDAWTAKAASLIRDVFETPCEVFFVFNGTSANSMALAAICQPYHAILCHERAHEVIDECGAPEFFAHGAKVIPLSGLQGKVAPAAVEQAATRRSDLHYSKVRALSLTQCTEVGTVYSVDEVKALASTAHRFGLKVHMDGARFANAAAALGAVPQEITWRSGVDVLSFGATKNGIAVGEAVVFFDRDLARDFEYRCKQGGQLASKMRFLTAPWVGILKNGAWLRHARHANAMAAQLAQALQNVSAGCIAFPCQSNSVFLHLPPAVVQGLHERGWRFHQMHGAEEYRLMCSWDTTPEDVDAFAKDLKQLLA